MIFYKKPFVLNENNQNEEIKNIIRIYRKGNFRKSNKLIKKVDENSLSSEEKLEYEKLRTMLSIDYAGLILAFTVLAIVIYLLIDYCKI